MKKTAIAFGACFLLSGPIWAQHGNAENGYYPSGYHGDTWSGVVVAVNDQTREVTLEYKKGDRVERFVGTMDEHYMVHEHNGPTRPLKMTDIPMGRTVKVWYMNDTRKIDGKKVKISRVFLVDAVANAAVGRADFMSFTN